MLLFPRCFQYHPFQGQNSGSHIHKCTVDIYFIVPRLNPDVPNNLWGPYIDCEVPQNNLNLIVPTLEKPWTRVFQGCCQHRYQGLTQIPRPRGLVIYGCHKTETQTSGIGGAKGRRRMWNIPSGNIVGWHSSWLKLGKRMSTQTSGLRFNVVDVASWRWFIPEVGAGFFFLCWRDTPPAQGIHEVTILSFACMSSRHAPRQHWLRLQQGKHRQFRGHVENLQACKRPRNAFLAHRDLS